MTNEVKEELKKNGMTDDIIDRIDSLIRDLDDRKEVDEHGLPIEITLHISHVDSRYHTDMNLNVGGVQLF